MHIILFIVSVLLLSSILLSKFTARLGVPTLLGFLLIGLLFGNGGSYDFMYDYPEFTLNIGQIALCIILFTGGLNTDINVIRPVIFKSLSLSFFGVILSAGIIGMVSYFFLPLEFLQCLLLGAIISSTDAAAVFSILESKGLKTKGQSLPIIELESGTNDPMAYFLTITLTHLIINETDFSSLDFFLFLGYNFVSGIAIGLLMGYLSLFLLKSVKLKTGLNPVLILSLIFFTFSFSEIIHANSLLSVYIMGIMIGNRKINASYISNFYEGVSWLMEILLFVTLGLQVTIQDLPPVLIPGLIISLFLIFVSRPASVFLCLSPFNLGIRSKTFISWVGLRGATPLVFALYPVVYNIPGAVYIFDITFFVVFYSILLQGSSVSLVAKWLRI